MKNYWMVWIGLFWILASCAPTIGENAPATKVVPAIETEVLPMTSPVNPSPVADSALEVLIARAKDDLSARLSVDLATIAVLRADAVNWSDGSLGCPQPDMNYAQVITPGYLIVLEANGVSFEYHASRGTEVVYCKNPMPPSSGAPMDQ